MEIIGIGTDLVAIARIRKIYEQYNISFAKRILSKKELGEFQKSSSPVSFLAKRYAAKEAVAKAIGTGFRPGSFWLTDISVLNDNMGKPHLEFSESIQKLFKQMGVTKSFISLSDEKDYALAFVILTGKN